MESLFTDEHGGKKTSQEDDGLRDLDNVAEGSWSELPPDILDLIANRLGIIELLRFRSTCKSWLSASVNASAEIERTPWFLLYDDDVRKCSLINNSRLICYIIDIRELEGANCIASDGGWLLVYKDGSVFFFCPFSRARIDLPPLPDSSFSECVGAISSSPTSQDCIVCVIHHQDSEHWVLYLIRRGATEWSKHVFLDKDEFLPDIMCAAYCDGIWYFRDSDDALVTFSSDKGEWLPYAVHSTATSIQFSLVIPFLVARNYFGQNYINNILRRRGEPFSISICGAKGLSDDDRIYQIFNVNITEPDADLHLKGVWIVPRFNQLPPNYSW